MSLSALLQATRSAILEKGIFNDSEVKVMMTPQPPPMVGNRFLSIYGNQWQPAPESDMHRGLSESYEIGCTITLRTQAVPYGSRGEKIYLREEHGILALMRKVIVAIHQNHEIINDANDLLEGNTAEPILGTYFRWRGGDAHPVLQGPEWFWSTDPTSQEFGVTLTHYFTGAARYQSIDNMA